MLKLNVQTGVTSCFQKPVRIVSAVNPIFVIGENSCITEAAAKIRNGRDSPFDIGSQL